MAIMAAPDGRKLNIVVSGPSDGVPLLFHHGTPSGVRQLSILREATVARGLRLVTYARPGYGDSTRLPGRTVASVVADAAAVLDHLDVPRCLVAGWSGGGPHALATAAGLPERVAGVLSIAGVGPNDAPDLDFLAGMGEGNLDEFGLAAQGEEALHARLEVMAATMRGEAPSDLVTSFGSLLPEVDQAVLAGEFGSDVAAMVADGVRSGADGWVDDDLAFLAPWGFSLADLSVPVFLWQGSEDLMVPFAHGKWLAERIPHATVHLEPGHGHLSILHARIDTMLDELSGTL